MATTCHRPIHGRASIGHVFPSASVTFLRLCGRVRHEKCSRQPDGQTGRRFTREDRGQAQEGGPRARQHCRMPRCTIDQILREREAAARTTTTTAFTSTVQHWSEKLSAALLQLPSLRSKLVPLETRLDGTLPVISSQQLRNAQTSDW